MPYHRIHATLSSQEAPFEPLAEAHAAYGRLQTLTSLTAEIAATGDPNAISAAHKLAESCAHHVNYAADRADELAQQPDSREAARRMPALTNTLRGLAKTELKRFKAHAPHHLSEPPHRQVEKSATRALRSATDPGALKQLLPIVRNPPEGFALQAAAVRLGQNIRDDNALRANDGQDPYRGPARETLSWMAQHGSTLCKALEQTLVEANNHNLQFVASPELSRNRATVEAVRDLPVTPTLYQQGPAPAEASHVHVVVFQHWGTKHAKEIWEPYPHGFPSHLAMEQMESAVASAAIAEPQDGYDGPAAAAMAAAALMGLHAIPAQQTTRLMDEAAQDAPIALLILTAGDRAAATLLARQAGAPHMEFPANPPETGSRRFQEAARKVERVMGARIASQSLARMGA